jgi:hypothetical protein
MRSITTLAMLGTSVLALTFAATAQAQPGDPGGAPGEAQPASPGVSLSLGGSSASDPSADTGTTEEEVEPKKEAKDEPLPWHGTVLIFDQSFTTQSVGVGDDYISDNPVYEMNLSFRPRYYFYEDDTHSFYAGLRLEASRELTNSDLTTRDNETLIGNSYLDAVYGVKVYKSGDWITQLGVGPRFIFPTDKYTYRGGNRLRLGGGVKAAQVMPLAGSKSTWFPSAMLQASLYYMKHINKSTTSTNDDFTRERQDAGGRTVSSDQFGTAGKVNHEMTTVVGAAVDVTSSLHLSASYVWITQWAYGFDDTQIDTTTGPTTPNRVEDPQTNRVIPWFMASLDYDVLPEMGIGAGYYNANSQIGPEGTRRNPLYSPDARFFFDITANLDAIYTTATGKSETSSNTAWARQQARLNTLNQSSF